MENLKQQIQSFIDRNPNKTIALLRTSTQPSVKEFLYIDKISETNNTSLLESTEDWIREEFKIPQQGSFDSVDGRLYIIAY